MARKTKKSLDNNEINIHSVKYESIDLEEELNRRMGIYAFNVNLERSIPSIIDGCKPTQRKILYTGLVKGFRQNKPFQKALKYIGAGSNYYVHGDASFYGTLISMAQDFYTKYPTIDVHGSYGAITGDPASAARYVEMRLSSYAEDLIKDLNQYTTDFKSNYDNTSEEPVIIPTIYPNLILNGSFGIGQGFTSSIPSHNFRDIVDRIKLLIKNPDISIDDLVKDLVPDYPTGGIIINKKDLPNMYKTGKGTIKIRGKVEIINNEIVITSIPYMKNTGSILDSIQKAVKEDKIQGISAIKDDTNATNGVYIRIIPKRGYDPRLIENQLYKFTPLQDGITFQLLCVTPDMLHFKYYNFKEVLEEWLKFRVTTIIRNYNSKITLCKKKIHIDEGLLIALDPKNLDKILKMIRNSKNQEDVINNLKTKYKMTHIQAEYISNLKLYQLTNMEIGKIEEDLEKNKQELEKIVKFLSNKKSINKYIIDELEEGCKKYGSERITEATDIDLDNINEAIIENSSHTLILTSEGFIKKLPELKVQNISGSGINTGKIKENDFIRDVINCNNLDNLLFFTNTGRVYTKKVYEIKESTTASYGIIVNSILELKENEKVITLIKLDNKDFSSDSSFLLFITKNGLIKKTLLNKFASIPKSGLASIDLNKEDMLKQVLMCKTDTDIIVGTDNGHLIKYNTITLPPVNRLTKGIKSISLENDEKVISVDICDKNKNIVIITSKGNGKSVKEKVIKLSERTKKPDNVIKLVGSERVVAYLSVTDEDNITCVSNKKIIKIPANQISNGLLISPGKKIVNVMKNDSIISVSK